MKRIIFIAAALGASVVAHAQDKPAFTFNHLALSVRDINRSVDFYKNVMNLQEIENRTRVEGRRWFVFGGGVELHLISDFKEGARTNKAVHLAVTSSDFDSFVKRLDQAKVVYSDWPGTVHAINKRADGVRQIFFQDPDGYWIEVNSVGEN